MKNNTENRFVVYAHYTADTNQLFYIGEGTLERSKRTNHRNRYWNFKVAKHGFTVRILYSGLDKQESQNIETRLIRNLLKRGVKLTNFCIGPLYKRSWLLNAPKELHPMFGKKNPKASERMKQYNKEHSGEKSHVFGKKRKDLTERNKNGIFKRFAKKVKCVETGEIFSSIREAILAFGGKPNSTSITKHLKGIRKLAFGHHWEYVISN